MTCMLPKTSMVLSMTFIDFIDVPYMIFYDFPVFCMVVNQGSRKLKRHVQLKMSCWSELKSCNGTAKFYPLNCGKEFKTNQVAQTCNFYESFIHEKYRKYQKSTAI